MFAPSPKVTIELHRFSLTRAPYYSGSRLDEVDNGPFTNTNNEMGLTACNGIGQYLLLGDCAATYRGQTVDAEKVEALWVPTNSISSMGSAPVSYLGHDFHPIARTYANITRRYQHPILEEPAGTIPYHHCLMSQDAFGGSGMLICAQCQNIGCNSSSGSDRMLWKIFGLASFSSHLAYVE